MVCELKSDMCLADTSPQCIPVDLMRSVFPRFAVSLLIALYSVTGSVAVAGRELIEVRISPESRVKAAEGDALRELTQGSWCEFDIVIHNAAGITSPLQIESENLMPDASSTPGRDQWLRLELMPQGPLSGDRRETRKLRLWTDHTGVRSAVVNVNAGREHRISAFAVMSC